MKPKGELIKLIGKLEEEPNFLKETYQPDLTEPEQVNLAFLESENRYNAIFQNSLSCIAVYNSVDEGEDFEFVDFNPMAERVEKLSKEEVIGSS